ncbi:GNAT family N-acetyltransferase [Nitriliruptor alkaliphilus]|uniref:GNAT family N-acetyltransferase n=1 Tax=Nitriliruptor alkaliphilus TaxID=427918 RepID=UPI000697A390|nr:GNAT family N-acetyltransferase [Nitriliruptor alkaliphilus]
MRGSGRRDEEASEGDASLGPFDVAPGAWSREVHLRDGSPVLLRQIRPSDRTRLAEGLKRLSPASRYLRFQRAVSELSDEELRYLTEVDHVDHEAIVALDPVRPDRPGVGVARYIREPYEPEVAEAAITVADEYHGRGAGTLLLGALASRAEANGVKVFRSYVLDGNSAMLEVFDHLGARRALETSGLWRVDLDVPRDEASIPESGAGRAFHHAASEEHHLVSLLPPIWSRRRRRKVAGDLAAETAEAGTISDDDTAELLEIQAELEGWFERPEER